MSTVLLDRVHDDAVAVFTLNRPCQRNALNTELISDLRSLLATLAAEPALRVLIVRGAGDRAFCAGADLTERMQMDVSARAGHAQSIRELADELAAFPTPVIAEIRGFALAGGAELALACDIRIAADDAVFGFPEVRVGIFAGAGGVIRLPAVVGHGIAAELLMTGRQFVAEEAVRIGFVSQVSATGQLHATTLETALAIAANAPLAERALKRSLLAVQSLPGSQAGALVNAERESLDDTSDYAEGLRAFAEKRRPDFQGS